MDLTENLIRDVAVHVRGTAALQWEGMDIDLGPAFRRWSMSDAVLEHNPEIAAGDLRDVGKMREHCRRLEFTRVLCRSARPPNPPARNGSSSRSASVAASIRCASTDRKSVG